MNRHFWPKEWNTEIPERGFARVDHVEPASQGGETVLVALDVIDASWIAYKGREDPRFDLERPDASQRAWDRYARDNGDLGRRENPFENAPLFRVEVEFPATISLFGMFNMADYRDTGEPDSAPAALEAAWIDLRLAPVQDGGVAALAYPGLFADPVSIYVSGTMVTPRQGKALAGIFSLNNLPAISTSQLAGLLGAASADYMAVYDVGQGNSNALLGTDAGATSPTLYFDLGAGVYRNKHTTPSNLIFCFTRSPPIVLSHWDADHWAGAYANASGGSYPALTQTWVAPMQTVGPLHVAFAHDVISNGGTFHTYSPPAATVGSATLACGHTLRFTTGTGTDRNNTGIVLSVESPDSNPPRGWLLTGDCDYSFFMAHLAPLDPVALVAPHHGATLGTHSIAPTPLAPNTYRRLVYSFGSGNKHGKTRTQHPTAAGIQIHVAAGWRHGAWAASTPATCVAGADILETAIHSSGTAPSTRLGGCLIDWDSVPPATTPSCGSVSCTISPVRS